MHPVILLSVVAAVCTFPLHAQTANCAGLRGNFPVFDWEKRQTQYHAQLTHKLLQLKATRGVDCSDIGEHNFYRRARKEVGGHRVASETSLECIFV